MGKNTQKKAAAFNNVVENRENLITKINKCKTLSGLATLEKEYATQSRYSLAASYYKGLSMEKQQILANSDTRIKEALMQQKSKLMAIPEDEAVDSLVNESIVQESISSQFQSLRKLNISHIENELVNIDKKCMRMSKMGPSYEAATQATFRICSAIKKLTEKYVQDGDLQHFQDETRAIFDETTEDMKTINTHRGWAKNFFGNLGYFILGLGVGYAAVCAYRGKFFEFNTDTANVVGAVNEKIAALSMS
ncbi:hypothetical protein J2N86_06105 [Legionella lytica]|uniref:Uncharacterized protein n=1 Tax=Legionella lytica TaxID=96232 RepID=A0ABY4YBJ0_9GAMM|nr:hypothetical protein [Legionella lytica]USQ14869.1 hypothetical protein J2N86_06105 [Legionella lytica]